MRGNRTIKVSASELDAFHSPNMLPLAKMGINIDVDYRAIHRYQTKIEICWFYDFNTVNFFLWDASQNFQIEFDLHGSPIYAWNLKYTQAFFFKTDHPESCVFFWKRCQTILLTCFTGIEKTTHIKLKLGVFDTTKSQRNKKTLTIPF